MQSNLPSEQAVHPNEFRAHLEQIYEGLKTDDKVQETARTANPCIFMNATVDETVGLLMEPNCKWDVVFQNLMLLRAVFEQAGYIPQSIEEEYEG